MARIDVGHGRFALVDDEDYDRVVALGKWRGELING